MISSGVSSITLNDILSKTSEAIIISYYLSINKIPCVIRSPLRNDKKPSFGFYSTDGKRIFFKDFSTGQRGGLIDLLMLMWSCTYIEALEKIYKDIIENKGIKEQKRISKCINRDIPIRTINPCNIERTKTSKPITIECRTRDWKEHDIEYWSSYNISLDWLRLAEVYPISHKIITKNKQKYTFVADKYAYAYVEHKEGKTSIKIYQPFNTQGYKWCNNHDASVISLWTKVPLKGDKICICSSLKDALVLWANTSIPAIAPQGEGYKISDTAANELRKRFNNIYICFDNDEAGIKDAILLSKETGFINIVLPNFEEGKDLADLMKAKGPEEFTKLILPLFNK